MKRYRVYTGPAIVNYWAKEWSKLPELSEVYEGTETVWFDTELSEYELSKILPTWARPHYQYEVTK